MAPEHRFALLSLHPVADCDDRLRHCYMADPYGLANAEKGHMTRSAMVVRASAEETTHNDENPARCVRQFDPSEEPGAKKHGTLAAQNSALHFTSHKANIVIKQRQRHLTDTDKMRKWAWIATVIFTVLKGQCKAVETLALDGN